MSVSSDPTDPIFCFDSEVFIAFDDKMLSVAQTCCFMTHRT